MAARVFDFQQKGTGLNPICSPFTLGARIQNLTYDTYQFTLSLWIAVKLITQMEATSIVSGEVNALAGMPIITFALEISISHLQARLRKVKAYK